ncbi:PTS sugar transporter subunit IIA [Mycoplasma cottewii]|uniref:Ascorbate-specific PTS system EIIA component n=1 Tax=Mycoplasma cottewii TaxID=51364 RepID=A0ABY5TXZ9_9MOLU|nr:PTS sugar transporter subunit IIA [Mycoplasma cottewii]UWD35080.1 PTS sugar transporter subunit IIA [Mycoplasma cottewii]
MLFKKELINFVDNEINSWQKAIEIASESLIKNNYVDDSYWKEIIEITDKTGPYYIVAPKIALLHLSPKPEWKDKENALSLTVFKNSIKFKQEPRYHVNFCLALFAKDNSSHIDIMQKFAILFTNQKFLAELENAKNIDDVYKVLERYDT